MNQILSVAIKQLSDRNCSERDLRRHLEKEFMALPELDKCIDESIARLRELHLINDNRLAESIAQRYSHKGNRFIAQTLRQKGVSDEVITCALDSLNDEYSRALDEARRKGGRKTEKSVEEIKTGLVRFLSGRGFSHDSIKAVIRELRDEGFFSSINIADSDEK
jgi:regulatory protein